MKKKLTCSCGATFESEICGTNSYNVGELEKESNWMPVFIAGAGIKWICPTCAHEVEVMASKIRDIIEDDNIYFPGLLREKNEK